MKYASFLNEKCATMTQTQMDIIDTAMSLIPNCIHSEMKTYGVTISMGTPAQMLEWFNYQFVDTVAGASQGRKVYLNQDKFTGNEVLWTLVDVVLHEYMHGYTNKCIEFNDTERSSEGKRFKDIYDTEKDNITFDEADGHMKGNTMEFYASSFAYYLYYKNNQIKLNQLFGRTPKLRAFIKEIILASPPVILQDMEDEKKRGVEKVEIGVKTGGGDNALKVWYKKGTYYEYDLGSTGGGSGDGIVIQNNTIDFNTPYSGIPKDKITYSIVKIPNEVWLLISYRLSGSYDYYDIMQDRILLQTYSGSNTYGNEQVTERRYFDYNTKDPSAGGSRTWTAWKKVNKENLTSVSLSNSKYTLTKGEFQKINNNGNASAVVTLPSVSDYTPIKLIVTCNTTGTISFEHARPIKWNTTALSNITSGKTYEIDMQYIDYATGWICKYNTY